MLKVIAPDSRSGSPRNTRLAAAKATGNSVGTMQISPRRTDRKAAAIVTMITTDESTRLRAASVITL